MYTTRAQAVTDTWRRRANPDAGRRRDRARSARFIHGFVSEWSSNHGTSGMNLSFVFPFCDWDS